MAMLECLQPEASLKHIRLSHENATQQFGSDNISVWLDYIKFEMKHGEPKKTGSIHMRAVKTLNCNLTDSFIKEHSLFLAKPDSTK